MGYVLVYDPVPDHCALITELLKRGGLAGSCHSDPTRVIATAQGAYPSCLIIDLERSAEALALLRELDPILSERNIPIIAVYAGRSDGDLPHRPFAAKIRKPIDQETLMKAIRRAVAEEV